jgi:predicted transcriptional regulator
MQLHERLIQETEGLPEPMLVEVLDFLQGLKGRSYDDSLPMIDRQALMERVEYLETVLGIQKGLASFDRGEGIPVDEAFESLRQKFNIPSRS